MMNEKTKGVLYGAVAAATYGMNPLFALPLYEEGMSPDSVLFFRYLLALPLLGCMIRARGRSFRLNRREIVPLAALGGVMAFSSLGLFLSFTYMAAGIASTLLFVYPILVALIMALFFHERITLLTSGCIALALTGIGLLYRSGDGATLDPAGVALVLLSSLAYALYLVAVNLPRLKEIPTVKLTFYVLLFGWVLFVARIGLGGGLQLPVNPVRWLNLGAPDRRVAGGDYAGHSIYRLHADGHSGGARTPYGRLLRRGRVRRTADAPHDGRHGTDSRRRDDHRRRRPDRPFSGAVPQTVPAAAPQAQRLI